MTVRAKMTTTGLAGYMEAIERTGKDVDRSAANAVQAGSGVMQDGMQRRVAILTGNLRDHIKIKGPQQDGNFVFCEVGIINEKGFTDADTARYGNVQEYGSAKTPAHPYIRPTMAEDKSKALRKMRESLVKDGTL